MLTRTLAAILTAATLLACRNDIPADSVQDTAAAELTSGGAFASVFVDSLPSPEAQLVFVGEDSSMRPAERPNAVFVPFSTFSVERDGIPNEFPAPDSMALLLEAAGVQNGDVVIVGDPIPAGRAFAAFDYLGLGDRTALLNGGTAGLAPIPVSPNAPGIAVDRGRLQVNVRDDMIVDAEWVHARLDDSSIVMIDARPPAEFSGATPGEGITRPGHIPGAKSMFWQTLVRSPENPRLKDEAELRRMFEEAGVGPGVTIVAYCRTGGQSAFLYSVARELGYEVRLYDGSFVDWSRTSYPVER
jgi:thiosulfate/3-mercaptopyruvate sulfurtransferase